MVSQARSRPMASNLPSISLRRQQCLYFLPLPQGQGSFLPILLAKLPPDPRIRPQHGARDRDYSNIESPSMEITSFGRCHQLEGRLRLPARAMALALTKSSEEAGHQGKG